MMIWVAENITQIVFQRHSIFCEKYLTKDSTDQSKRDESVISYCLSLRFKCIWDLWIIQNLVCCCKKKNKVLTLLPTFKKYLQMSETHSVWSWNTKDVWSKNHSMRNHWGSDSRRREAHWYIRQVALRPMTKRQSSHTKQKSKCKCGP